MSLTRWMVGGLLLVVACAPAVTRPRTFELPSTLPTQGQITEPDDWVQVHGTTIYYRHQTYLPRACEGPLYARGNWSRGWDGDPVPFCSPAGWLAFDVRPLLMSGRMKPDQSYCINFVNAFGGWGQHGAQGAPFGDWMIPARQGISYGMNIGIRYDSIAQRLVLSNQNPADKC
jgi:hypothetical protein